MKLLDVEFSEGDELIKTGAPCDDASPNLYFISNGRAEVKVDGKGVRKLQSPFMIGDAKMLQVRRRGPTAPRRGRGFVSARAVPERARRGAARRARRRLASARVQRHARARPDGGGSRARARRASRRAASFAAV